MGLSLRKLFKAREKPGEDVQRVSSVEIADQQVRDAVTESIQWLSMRKNRNTL